MRIPKQAEKLTNQLDKIELVFSDNWFVLLTFYKTIVFMEKICSFKGSVYMLLKGCMFSCIFCVSFLSSSAKAQIDTILNGPLTPSQRTSAEYLNKICLPVVQINGLDEFCKTLTEPTDLNPELRDFSATLPPVLSFEVLNHELAIQNLQDQLYRRVSSSRKEDRKDKRNIEVFAGGHRTRGDHQERTGDLNLDLQFGSGFIGSVYEVNDKLRLAGSLSSLDAGTEFNLSKGSDVTSEGISFFLEAL